MQWQDQLDQPLLHASLGGRGGKKGEGKNGGGGGKSGGGGKTGGKYKINIQ